MSNQQVIALHSNHHLYYSIARQNLNQGQQIQKQIEDRERQYLEIESVVIQSSGRVDPDYAPIEIARRMESLRSLCQHSTQAVIFAALTAEAFINYYSVRKSSLTYFKNHFENLQPMQKWLIIPALFNAGNSLEPGKEPLQSLSYLVRTRNDLVHAKPQTAITLGDQGFHLSPSTENYYEPSIETASKCVTTVSNLVRGLKKIDELIETDWLNEEIFMRHFSVVTDKI